jgi:Xaa-Pro aminopeptidase
VDHQVRRRALGARLDALGVDALFVTDLINVRYLTGFTGSNAQILITPDGGTFLTDGRYVEQAAHEVDGIERRGYRHHYRDEVRRSVASSGAARVGFEANALTVAAHAELAEALGEVELVATRGAVEFGRRVKDEDEWELLRRAQAITDAAFEAVLDRCSVGMTEQQLARDLEHLMRDEGADGLAFDPIVAFGEDAAQPHHEPGHRPLEEGDIVKMDFGALAGGYHADMTRTVCFGAAPTELRKIHDVVREAQQAGIDAIRAGVSGSEVDAASRAVIEGAGYGERFVHGLGHGVGLQIHERPWLSAHDSEPLPAGTIVTVEPGIYIPGLGGVRIEDTVEVTEDGSRVLPTSTRELLEL